MLRNRYTALAMLAILALGGVATVGTLLAGKSETGSPDTSAVNKNNSADPAVILMIGDGMGFEQLDAASLFAYGRKGKLTLQQLPVRGDVATHPAEGKKTVTDSAAAGTAIATGVKVRNGVLSLRIPGNGERLETLLEIASDRGLRTGLVSTTHLTHATPAAFGAHVVRRDHYDDIAEDLLNRSRPDLLLGGGGKGLKPDDAESAGYAVALTRRGLQRIAERSKRPARVAGLFGEGHMPYEYEYAMRINSGYDRLPHLSEMTAFALEHLSAEESGFFLMVESGRIDHAGHTNHVHNNVMETLEFDNAVRTVLKWAAGRENVLVVVTSDHETGGMKVTGKTALGVWPEVSWASKGHTGVNVPLYATGPGARAFVGSMDNTDIFRKLRDRMKLTSPAAKDAAAVGAGPDGY
ncbi:MAG: alkaline phosphatase [Phycisphaerae bacterium]